MKEARDRECSERAVMLKEEDCEAYVGPSRTAGAKQCLCEEAIHSKQMKMRLRVSKGGMRRQGAGSAEKGSDRFSYPSIRDEAPKPVGVHIDDQLYSEDDCEGDVHVVKNFADVSARSVFVIYLVS